MAGRKMTTKGGMMKKPGGMNKGGTVKAKQTKFKKPSNKKDGLFGR